MNPKIHPYSAAAYPVTETGVSFSCTDPATQSVFDRCESLAKENIKFFGDRRVMQEGAKYHGVWMETQPMGGEMYASRDMEIALNNHLIFMKYQRRDGRIPGMITYRMPWDGIACHFDWMQGDFFTVSAWRMYYLLGKNKQYARLLYNTLRDFDDYLWQWRDSDGDGCLESWCAWDTGDDNNTRFIVRGIHPRDNGPACGELPPENAGMFPFESAEYMAYSYSHRAILAKISDELGLGEGDHWRAAAEGVRRKLHDYLWDEDRGAVYDRDRNNEMMYTLTLESLKCMYHGAFTQEMADRFVAEHLMNPAEFFTPLPLPNIAANDPLFYVNESCNNLSPEHKKIVHEMIGHDSLDNSWSGAVEGLSVQRSIDALCRYGHFAEAAIIGRKWIDALSRAGQIVQQYEPMTGRDCPGSNGYGPALLSALEYITFLCGVDYAEDVLRFGAAKNGFDSTFTQKLFGHTYTLTHKNGTVTADRDGETWFTVTEGVCAATDMEGNLLSLTGMESVPADVTLTVGGREYRAVIGANEEWILHDGALTLRRRIPFGGKA